MRRQGVVKWFNDTKGYGFIICDEDESEAFVHYSAIAKRGHRSLNEGDRVEFILSSGPKGLNATNVTVVSTASGSERAEDVSTASGSERVR